MRVLASYPMRAVHLAAAWAFAVSEPIFSMVLANPEFLIVRGASRFEVVAFALSLTLIPPLAALLTVWLVSLVSSRAADYLYLVVLGTLVVVLVAQGLKRVGYESSAILFIALAAAAAAVIAYVRWAPVRLLFTVAVCLPVLALVVFVARAPVVPQNVTELHAPVRSKTPVVLVVFDELPISSLLTPSGELDAVRYPSFARLSRNATWYRHATTVHEWTTHAVPAILTGKLPQEGGLPTLAHHPNNLFTLLGETYRFEVSEHFTYLCPMRYCRRERDLSLHRMDSLFVDVAVAFSHRVLPEPLTSRLPRVDDRWGGFVNERLLLAAEPAELNKVGAKQQRDRLFETFLGGINGGEPDGTLHFVHALYPHFPWRLLPSGREMGPHHLGNLGLDGRDWTQERWVVQQTYQRHLLQVGYTDFLLGRLLRRLESAGLYDRALVIVTADHGISFVPGEAAREVMPENLADVASVPLFVKFPRQRKGAIDDRAVRTIDVLPTIADVLDVTVPWRTDGHSLLRTWREPTKVSVANVSGSIVELSLASVRARVRATLRRKVAFGRSWSDLLSAGLRRDLRGLDVDSIRVPDADTVQVSFDNTEALANLGPSSRLVPAWITGTIEGADLTHAELVVAINGRIVGAAGALRTQGRQRFSALVPEAALRDGSNRVELLAVARRGRTLALTRLGET